MIEVNEYVRTKKGAVGKLIEIDKKATAYYLDCLKCVSLKNIVKHSKQLIDLIEVGDVIKYKIENVALETKGYLKGITDISDKEMLRNIRNDKDYKVLEILTKEIYMANCYKAGEEDE